MRCGGRLGTLGKVRLVSKQGGTYGGGVLKRKGSFLWRMDVG